MKANCKTAKYYKENPEARKKRLEYQKEYNKRPSQKKKRAELNKANRKAGTYGNGDSKDASHKKSGKIVMEDYRKNRARNGANGKSTKK